jgi:periplasmic divalent cation tolerance protein
MAGSIEGSLVLVLTTEASVEKAERLAETLLRKGLVACVSLTPIVSLYQWQGRITRSEEVQLLLKTHQPCLAALYQMLMALHSYDTPEWITLQAHSQGAYGSWCAEQLQSPGLMKGGEPPDRSRSSGGGGPAG